LGVAYMPGTLSKTCPSIVNQHLQGGLLMSDEWSKEIKAYAEDHK